MLTVVVDKKRKKIIQLLKDTKNLPREEGGWLSLKANFFFGKICNIQQ